MFSVAMAAVRVVLGVLMFVLGLARVIFLQAPWVRRAALSLFILKYQAISQTV